LLFPSDFVTTPAPNCLDWTPFSVLENARTIISFRLGLADAEILEKEFYQEFRSTDLVRLPNHRVYLKLMVDGIVSRPFSAATLGWSREA
jgi:hypothetical protein